MPTNNQKKKNKGGRPEKLTPEVKDKIIAEMKLGVPLRYAAPLCGVTFEAARLHTIKDKGFLSRTEAAKSFAVRGLMGKVLEQNGAWKLLKNIGKEEFKERVEVEQHSTQSVILKAGDKELEFDI